MKEADGTERHVPTMVYQSGGTWFVRVSSLTNSVYALIHNEVSFDDAKDTWYAPAVNDLASREVISGEGDNLFAGDRNITRAEFAAILVRAQGLPANGNGTAFGDIRAGDWFCGAVGTVYAKVYTVFYKALTQAGRKRLPPYSCRHTTGTALGTADIPISIVTEIMRHTKNATTQRYVYLDATTILDA